MLPSPFIFVEQTDVVVELMPDLCDSTDELLGGHSWWCISKTLAEALEAIEGQVVINCGLGCWWAVPHKGAAAMPEATLETLGLSTFLA